MKESTSLKIIWVCITVLFICYIMFIPTFEETAWLHFIVFGIIYAVSSFVIFIAYDVAKSVEKHYNDK